jgi:ADP-heptose:LPS heptosyltransferase
MPSRMKIAVLRLGAMGDILYTTPALRGLRRKYPEARITYILLRKWRFLLKNNPNVDRVFGIAYREPKALGALRNEAFDLVVNLHEEADGARLCEALRARERRGNRWIDGLLVPDADSVWMLKDLESRRRHLEANAGSYAELHCRIAGVEMDSLRMDYFADRFATWRAGWFLGRFEGKILPIALHLHSRGSFARRWDASYALDVVRAFPTRRFVVLGYKKDRDATRPLETEPNIEVSYHSMSVQAEILRRCALFVGIDSGPRNVASAVGVPTLCLCGPIPPEIFPTVAGERVLLSNCPDRPCFQDQCPRGEDCLSRIPTGEIVDTMREMLGEKTG